MASTDTSTSSSLISAAEEPKRTVDEAFLNRLKTLVERLRLDNATLKKALDIERSEVRALKAQHEGTLRNLKTEYKKKEEFLEKQLRVPKQEKTNDDAQVNHRLIELKKLTTEIQALKSANKGLQEKLKVAQAAECARAAELRAQAAKHAAVENAARRDTRAQCHKLLEEIKSKERVIIQLRREVARSASQNDQTAEDCDEPSCEEKETDYDDEIKAKIEQRRLENRQSTLNTQKGSNYDPLKIKIEKSLEEFSSDHEEEYEFESNNDDFNTIDKQRSCSSKTISVKRKRESYDESNREELVDVKCDRIDLLFLGYAAAVKNLSRKKQISVKYDIAKILMEAELSELEKDKKDE